MSPHLTFSVPEPVYREMKKHPEIRWGEIARTSIAEHVISLKGSVHASELLKALPERTRSLLREIPSARARKLFKKLEDEEEWEVKSLTRAR